MTVVCCLSLHLLFLSPFFFQQILNKTWRRWQAIAPHPIPLPSALAFPPPSHRDATTPSPCWAPHFMTQERIMFPNPTPSKPRLSPAATMSDDTPSALTPPLSSSRLRKHCKNAQSVRRLQTDQASNTHRTRLHRFGQFQDNQSSL